MVTFGFTMHNMNSGALIPALYRDATTDLPEIDAWCSAVLSGARARLVLLGPVFSGKTHAAFAALRRLLIAGYPVSQIAAHKSIELVHHYQPSSIDDSPPVVLLDDITVRVDFNGAHSEPDEPEIQALMAAQQGALVDAAERLVSSNRSWILCGSTTDGIRATLGAELTDQILAVADITQLQPRPQTSPLQEW